MAVLVAKVATDVAIRAAKEVNKRHPGLWWKILSGVLVLALLLGLLVAQVATAVIAPIFGGGYSEMCNAEVADPGGSEDSHENEGGGSGGAFSTAKTPWPTKDSATVVYPVPSPFLTSGWGRRDSIDFGGVATPAFHNGLDFGQAMGSPVLSMADGVVAAAYAGNSLYGSHVAVKHRIGGKNIVSLYGHIQGASIKVKTGDVVKAGQQIASVGSEGMSTAPHLHFVLTNGDYSGPDSEPGYGNGGAGNTIDPAAFLSSKGAGNASGGIEGDDFSGVDGPEDTECGYSDTDFEGDGFSGWGGHENGEIPTSLLKTLSFASQKQLLAQAATDLETLNAGYKEKFGKDLSVTRAYEDAETGGGTSPFGWARAVQMELKFGTAEYDWVAQNGKALGWVQPAAYQEGGGAANAGRWGWKGSNSVPPAATPSAEKSRAIAKGLVIDQYRWSEADYVCLVKLWERESNWNHLAENPAGFGTPEGGAYGIPQSLPGSKMATEGADWRTNPETQIKWGLRYIKERYGTPCQAWAHSEAVNWY